MLTPIILSRAVTGGLLVLGMPVVFGSLLSLHYPGKQVSAAEQREAVERDARLREAAQSPSTVIGPERLESLRASRQRRRAPAADVSRAA
jgi:hypothetical protein